MTNKTFIIVMTLLSLSNLVYGQNKKNFWAKEIISTSKTPASEQILKEYGNIISKYVGTDKKWHLTFFDKITKADKIRLEELFKQMDSSQQANQSVIFIKPTKPFAKSVPTEEQYAKFKNSKVYGVWINDQKVDIADLDNYKNNDFSHYFVSKLYGAAKKNKTYTYQLDLMTNEYYKDYYSKKIKNKDCQMVVVKR